MSSILFLAFAGLVIAAIAMIVVDSRKAAALTAKRARVWLMLSLLPLVAWLSFVSVDAGTVGVVTRNGSATRILEPGGHFVVPLIERAEPVSVKTLAWKVSEDAASSDLQVVHTEVTVTYHFDPSWAIFIFSNLIDASPNAVENKTLNPTILEAIKSNTAKFTANDLIAKRPLVRDGIEEFIKARLAQYHIVAETTSITDFHFSKDYEESIESKVTAIQKSEQAQNDLTRIKIEAEQKIAAAEGEAAALKAQKEQITPELLQLRTIEMMSDRWDGKLPDQYYGGTAPLPIVDIFKNVGKK